MQSDRQLSPTNTPMGEEQITKEIINEESNSQKTKEEELNHTKIMEEQQNTNQTEIPQVTSVDNNNTTQLENDLTKGEIIETDRSIQEKKKPTINEEELLQQEETKEKRQVEIENETVKKPHTTNKEIKTTTSFTKQNKKETKVEKSFKILLFFKNEYGGISSRQSYFSLGNKIKKLLNTKNVKPYQTKDSWGIDDFYHSLMDLTIESRFNVMESRHDYVQWIFPTFVKSMFNWNSYTLDKEEANYFRQDNQITLKFIRMYRLFINFLGGDIVDLSTGKISPLPDEKIRKERFKNFNWSGHNYLRVTRIFNSLHAFGLKPYMESLFSFFKENIQHFKNCRDSMDNYWVKALNADRDINKEPVDFEYSDNSIFTLINKTIEESKSKETDLVMKKLETTLSITY
ncbi:hypothetical protein ENUP19_0122G0015 [Entamoeba nuttalli]|uniref:Opioid growth factor receptor (Ogfr) region protein, putative n=2 Tax=Entamoeba nuttalli TaxID=412467 RepID=K2H3C5_ENTNP|nr:opioid growth factor receptor (ogfr) region protein, putative [Entamoeba nuttalli P19]EKE36934.1 opioid growth factor receptor (ogfr) region protein, putative [Entamoeba nuttalli P19]|eukprot:XP_008860737.1 opioid growth factor receptor (ogfr) region protein, putative [Entamoeba nuttalli P19]